MSASKRMVLVMVMAAALAGAGCGLFIGHGCNMGWLTALSHPFTPCNASGD